MSAPAVTIEVIAATTPEQIAEAKALCLEYAESLGFSLCFQGFDQEMADFPGKYAHNAGGALLLGLVDGRVAGAVALRDLGDGACEMKRLFVRPVARGTGLGGRLAEAIIAEGGRLGYRVMRLDTLPSMAAAVALYCRLGFVPIPPYTYNPVPGAMFFERALV